MTTATQHAQTPDPEREPLDSVERHGVVRVLMRDETAYGFRVGHEEALRQIIERRPKKRGTFTGYGPYGERLTLDMRNAECVVRWKGPQIVANRVESEERERRQQWRNGQ